MHYFKTGLISFLAYESFRAGGAVVDAFHQQRWNTKFLRRHKNAMLMSFLILTPVAYVT
jgi:hypothetical protein